mgnify:CR=1 FL=1
MEHRTSENLAQEKGWSRELLYQLVENVKDYAIFVADLDGKIVSWNVGAEKLFGYTAKEAIGQDIRQLFTHEDRADRIPEMEMETAREKGWAEDERWHLRKDGTRFFASGIQTPLYDKSGRHTGYAKIARDLTERIDSQEELRKAYEGVEAEVQQRTGELSAANEALRSEIKEHQETERLRAALLHQIVRTQENERKRIAREIHDHIGQQLTGLQLRLQLLLDQYQENPAMAGELSQLQAIANQIDSDVDFLAWELRPSVLDEFGLVAALGKFVKDWSEHFKIPAEFDHNGLDGKTILPETEINLYRIVQEALNNISKYAESNRVSVLLEHRERDITLIVEDNGVGFEPSKKAVLTGNERGMGLLSMKERAELVGGTFDIESTIGGGTTVFVRVPVHFDAKKYAEPVGEASSLTPTSP